MLNKKRNEKHALLEKLHSQESRKIIFNIFFVSLINKNQRKVTLASLTSYTDNHLTFFNVN